MNPKAITQGQLYGEADLNTQPRTEPAPPPPSRAVALAALDGISPVLQPDLLASLAKISADRKASRGLHPMPIGNRALKDKTVRPIVKKDHNDWPLMTRISHAMRANSPC